MLTLAEASGPRLISTFLDEYSRPHPEAVEILHVQKNSPLSDELKAGDCVLMVGGGAN